MKKYLSKKRVCAILLSICMLISAIVMIPIPIEHVRAEDVYSEEGVYSAEDIHTAEETAGSDEPIILFIDDDGDDIENIVIETPDDDNTYIDEDDTDDINADIGDDVRLCEDCGEVACVCNDDHDTKLPAECEHIEGECKCGIRSRALPPDFYFIIKGINRNNFNDLITRITNATPNLTQNQTDAITDENNKRYSNSDVNYYISIGTGIEIYITENIPIASTITIPANRKITLVCEASTAYKFTVNSNIRHFVINRFGSLILRNIALEGNPTLNESTSNNIVRGGVDINGGTLAIEKGSKIYNCFNSRTNGTGGGAVTLTNEGLFNMFDGEIYNNVMSQRNAAGLRGGGAVYSGADCKFLMYNGEIYDNVVRIPNSTTAFRHTGGGGVYVAANGRMGLIGGTVRDNKATPAFGTQNGGGGIFIGTDGELSVFGGFITRNTAFRNGENRQNGGGGILVADGATLNLYGGRIYNNISENPGKGIAWVGGTINLRGNPIVGGSGDTDSIFRLGSNPQNQIMNITGSLLGNAFINVEEDINDRGRSDTSNEFTVIAVKAQGQGNASEREASLFHYMGTGDTRSLWSVIPHTPDGDPRLILGKALTKFTLLHVPEAMHFGERPLYTTKLVGPYGDAPNASDVEEDFKRGTNDWLYGFEVANTRNNSWSVTLKATPFVSDGGIVGAIPMALKSDETNPAPLDLTQAKLKIFASDAKGESIKWHWTQLQYKIEAQTNLDTVVKDDYKSTFTWELLSAP